MPSLARGGKGPADAGNRSLLAFTPKDIDTFSCGTKSICSPFLKSSCLDSEMSHGVI